MNLVVRNHESYVFLSTLLSLIYTKVH